MGKLLKRKSGQASQPLTSRSKWQLSAFQFLSSYIKPRTYQHDTGMPDDQDEPVEVGPESMLPESESETSAASMLGVTRDMKRARTKVNKVDEALLRFLSQPRESQQLLKKVRIIFISQ